MFKKITLLLLFVLCCALGAGSTPAFATDYVVTKTADTNDGTCNADCSLREAIVAANNAASNDHITFDAAVFASKQTITLGGSELGIANNGKLTITGPAAGVVISGNDASRVIKVSAGADVTLEKLTVSNGSLAFVTSAIYGGGIYNEGTLTLNRCTVSDNHVITSSNFAFGGGLASSGTLKVTASTFSDNSAQNGGGMYLLGGTALVTGSTFTENSASACGEVLTLL